VKKNFWVAALIILPVESLTTTPATAKSSLIATSKFPLTTLEGGADQIEGRTKPL
jgi:hypothetical protein